MNLTDIFNYYNMIIIFEKIQRLYRQGGSAVATRGRTQARGARAVTHAHER